jgi:hypothetical protein
MRRLIHLIACAFIVSPLIVLAQQPSTTEAIVPTKAMPLFNGKDLTGWTADVPERTVPDAPQPVRDGMLSVRAL